MKSHSEENRSVYGVRGEKDCIGMPEIQREPVCVWAEGRVPTAERRFALECLKFSPPCAMERFSSGLSFEQDQCWFIFS